MKRKSLLFALFFAFSCNLFAESKPEGDTTKVYKTPSITVSTNRAEERISPVPFSEIQHEEIKNNYTTRDLPYLLSGLPSVTISSQNGNFIGYTDLKMRGFDGSRLSIMVNGIPQNDAEGGDFYWINVSDLASSLDNIQVQRGAGISSYGAPAIGGTINMTTKNYLREKGAKIYSGIGLQEFGADGYESGQNVSKFMAEVSSGLTGNYAVYAKLARINSFGYRDQSFAYLNSYFLSFSRFDSNFTTQLNIYGGSQEDGLAYTGLPKSYATDARLRLTNYSLWGYDETGKTVGWYIDRRKQEVENFAEFRSELLNDWKISNNLTLKSAVFFKQNGGFFDYDGQGTTAFQFRLDSLHGYPGAQDPRMPIIRAFVGNRYGGWIPRLVWNHEGGTLTTGIEMRFNRAEHWGKLNYAENFPEGFNPDFNIYSFNSDKDVFSVFGSEQYNLSDKLMLNAEVSIVKQRIALSDEKSGGIYTSYEATDGNTVSGSGDIFSMDYWFVNPRLGINYNINEELNTYASVAYTSREPRLSNLYAAESAMWGATPLFAVDTTNGATKYDFSNPLVKPESMVDIELGVNWRNERFNFNINGYWMDYFDELVKSGQVDIYGVAIDGNAKRTRHIGLELQAAAMLIESDYGKIILSANATLSSNKIIDYEFALNDGTSVQLKDNDIAGFPDFMANARLTYNTGEFYCSIDMKHVGGFNTNNFGDMMTTNQQIINYLQAVGYYADNRFDPYTVFNADLSYTFKNILSLQSFKVTAQALNLTNLLYAAGADGPNFFPAAERSFYFGFELGL